MKSGQGSFKWKRTVRGSTISTCSTRVWNSLNPVPRYRSKLNFTSSAVTGSPLWNLRSRRSLNSYMSPSGLSVHDSARLLPIFCPGSGRTSASWSAYSMPKGVICGGAVDGSNQVGAMVTGQAITASPAGVDWPCTPWTPPSVSAAATSSRTIRRCDSVIPDSRVCGPIFFFPLYLPSERHVLPPLLRLGDEGRNEDGENGEDDERRVTGTLHTEPPSSQAGLLRRRVRQR